MTRRIVCTILALSPLLTACGEEPPPVQGDPPPYELVGMTLLTEDGGRVDWSPDGQAIAFDRLGDDGKWDLWLMDADGGDAECLSCEHPDLPSGDMGQPAWHPSGEWLVFQVESPDHPTDAMPTHPGAGVYNDLMLMRMEDRAVFMLYDVADGTGDDKGGTLHAVFSHAGDKLLFTDYQRSCWTCPVGDWQIALADVVLDGDAPRLGDRVNYEPGEKQLWYETHGFGPDDSWIYFSAATEGQNFLSSDLVRMDLDTAPAYQRITTTAGFQAREYWAYDEHAKLSPAGDAIIWLSDESGVAEYWMANPDGSGRFQLTAVNTAGHAHAALVNDLYSVPSDNAWNPAAAEGTAQALGFVQVDFHLTENTAPENFIVLMDFEIR